jgi:hypothetical protein
MSTIWGLKAALALGATMLLGHTAASLLSPLPGRKSTLSAARILKAQGVIGLIAACLYGLALVSYSGEPGASLQEKPSPVSVDSQE